MEGLFGLIFWIIVIVSLIGKSQKKNDGKRQSQPNVSRTNTARPNVSRPGNARGNQTMDRVNTFVRENVAKFENQAARWMESTDAANSSTRTYRTITNGTVPTSNRNTPSQGYRATSNPNAASAYRTAQGAKPATPDIVARAKANAKKYEEDATLQELEKEHQHSERVSSAEAAYVEKEREEHRKMHTEPTPRVEDESLLGSVEDLMVKGYDGNLSFERDFVGEAMDMINRFTLAE